MMMRRVVSVLRDLDPSRSLSQSLSKIFSLAHNVVKVSYDNEADKQAISEAERQLIDQVVSIQPHIKLSLIFFLAPIYDGLPQVQKLRAQDFIDRNSWVYNGKALDILSGLLSKSENGTEYADQIQELKSKFDSYIQSLDKGTQSNKGWSWFTSTVPETGTQLFLDSIPKWLDARFSEGGPNTQVMARIRTDLHSQSIYSTRLLEIISGDCHDSSFSKFLDSEYVSLKEPVARAVLNAQSVRTEILEAVCCLFNTGYPLLREPFVQAVLRSNSDPSLPILISLLDPIPSLVDQSKLDLISSIANKIPNTGSNSTDIKAEILKRIESEKIDSDRFNHVCEIVIAKLNQTNSNESDQTFEGAFKTIVTQILRGSKFQRQSEIVIAKLNQTNPNESDQTFEGVFKTILKRILLKPKDKSDSNIRFVRLISQSTAHVNHLIAQFVNQAFVNEGLKNDDVNPSHRKNILSFLGCAILNTPKPNQVYWSGYATVFL